MSPQDILFSILTFFGMMLLFNSASSMLMKLQGWAQSLFVTVVGSITIDVGLNVFRDVQLETYIILRPFVYIFLFQFVVARISAYMVQTNLDRSKAPVASFVRQLIKLSTAILVIAWISSIGSLLLDVRAQFFSVVGVIAIGGFVAVQILGIGLAKLSGWWLFLDESVPEDLSISIVISCIVGFGVGFFTSGIGLGAGGQILLAIGRENFISGLDALGPSGGMELGLVGGLLGAGLAVTVDSNNSLVKGLKSGLAVLLLFAWGTILVGTLL